MTKILAQNKQYNGISASIQFINGVGETSNPYLINWFKQKGYEIVEDKVIEKPKEIKVVEEPKTIEKVVEDKPKKVEPKKKNTKK